MKYDVTFSCGHTATIELFGPTKDRERKISWYESSTGSRKEPVAGAGWDPEASRMGEYNPKRKNR